MTDEALIEAARAWIAEDPDPVTQRAGELLLSSHDLNGLRACFGERLTFGTAGLRGALGPGPNRMNRALVRRASAGFGQYVVNELGVGTMAVGYDARHGSRDFAEDTARVLAGLGFTVFLAREPVPTPLLAYAVRALGCRGGVMVTASHNPPQDNGYKVYWSNAAQIIPPQDAGISTCIDEVKAQAWIMVPEMADLLRAGRVRPIPVAVDQAYAHEVDALRTWTGPTDIGIVYTAMHGVGRKEVEQALKRNGYEHLHVVPEQGDPDPDFPTVAFPNPEEPGALDLALALATRIGADVVLANDPDADRLAVALPVPGEHARFRALTGNELGVLLADDCFRHAPPVDKPLVACSVVSSQLLGRMAAARGVACAQVLTGFKWIADAALKHAARGGHFVMGYEEAIGYSVGEVVRDKDGVSAALLVADMVARARAEGATLFDRLAAIYQAHGVHRSRQKSLRMTPAEGAVLMARIRANPPAAIGPYAIDKTTDFLIDKTGLPPSDLLAYHLEGGHRILVRPSGTEPKVKVYFEAVLPMAQGEALEAAEARTDAVLDALVQAFSAVV